MLKFNGSGSCSTSSVLTHLNTSYVKVQFFVSGTRNRRKTNLNTSYVKVQLSSQISSGTWEVI